MAIEHRVTDDMSSQLESGKENSEVQSPTGKEVLEIFLSRDGVKVTSMQEYENFVKGSRLTGRKIPMLKNGYSQINHENGNFPTWNTIEAQAKRAVPGFKELIIKMPANTSMENRRMIARANLYGGKVDTSKMGLVYNIMQVMAVDENGEVKPVMSYALTDGQAMDGRIYRKMNIDTTDVNPRNEVELQFAIALAEKENGVMYAEKRQEQQVIQNSSDSRNELVDRGANLLSKTQIAKARNYYNNLKPTKQSGIKLQEKLRDNSIPVDIDGVIGGETIAGVAKFQEEKGLSPIDGIAGYDTLTAMGFNVASKKDTKSFYV